MLCVTVTMVTAGMHYLLFIPKANKTTTYTRVQRARACTPNHYLSGSTPKSAHAHHRKQPDSDRLRGENPSSLMKAARGVSVKTNKQRSMTEEMPLPVLKEEKLTCRWTQVTSTDFRSVRRNPAAAPESRRGFPPSSGLQSRRNHLRAAGADLRKPETTCCR